MEGSTAESIDYPSIFIRDGWVCQICGKPVNPDEKYPSSVSPSIDHIVPLSRGGSHTFENVQLTHLKCNKQKFTKTLAEYRIYLVNTRKDMQE